MKENDPIIIKVIGAIYNAVSKSADESNYTIRFESCPYTKQCLSRVAGISFSMKPHEKGHELCIFYVSKDNKALQILYKGMYQTQSSLCDQIGNFGNVCVEYAKYLLNKSKSAKEIKKQQLEIPDAEFFKDYSLADLLNSIEHCQNRNLDANDQLLPEKTETSENISLEPESLYEQKAEEPHVDPIKKHNTIVDDCISKVSDTCSVSLKLDNCPYKKVFYPWLDSIEFFKEENCIMIVAKGSHSEQWDYDKATDFVDKFNTERYKTLQQVLNNPGNTVYHVAKQFVDSKMEAALQKCELQYEDLDDGTRISFIPQKIIIEGGHDIKNRLCNHEIDSRGNVLKTKTVVLMVNIRDHTTGKWNTVYQEFWDSHGKYFHSVPKDGMSALYQTITDYIQKCKKTREQEQDKDTTR